MTPGRVSACVVLSMLLWTGCSRSPAKEPSPTATADEKDLAAMVDGLCRAREEASKDPRAARTTYERRSRAGVDLTIRVLQPSYSILASEVTEAKAAVESDLAGDPPPPSLDLKLARLVETVREALARFGVRTSACEK